MGGALLIALATVGGGMSPADGSAPSFSIGPYLQSVTETSIIVCWESDVAADARVEYWLEGAQTSSLVTVGSDVRHEVVLEDLQPGASYRYRIRVPSEGEGSFFTAGFRTAPAQEVPFVFGVYGDSREADEEDMDHKSVAQGIRALNPAFVIHTGDLVNRGDSERFWGIFWGTVAPPRGEESLAGNCAFYPVIGNHEYIATEGGYRDAAILNYQAYFVLPAHGLEAEHPEWVDRLYSFRYGPAFFIVLDANKDSDPDYDPHCAPPEGPPDIHPGSPQYEWLVEQLEFARGHCAFTFVCLHQCPYSSGPWGSDSAYKLRFLDPVFRDYGVDAVFSSHDHFYERCETYIHDYRLLYFVEGAGGATRYARSSGWDVPGSWMWDEFNHTFYTKAFDNSSYSFIKVEIVPLGSGRWRATFSATRPSGEVFDVAEIERFTASFASTPGQTYQVEYANSLQGIEPEWLPLGRPIRAEGLFICITDDGLATAFSPTNETVRQRFYRACELP